MSHLLYYYCGAVFVGDDVYEPIITIACVLFRNRSLDDVRLGGVWCLLGVRFDGLVVSVDARAECECALLVALSGDKCRPWDGTVVQRVADTVRIRFGESGPRTAGGVVMLLDEDTDRRGL